MERVVVDAAGVLGSEPGAEVQDWELVLLRAEEAHGLSKRGPAPPVLVDAAGVLGSEPGVELSVDDIFELERLAAGVEKYSEDQPRDELGRWTEVGSAGEFVHGTSAGQVESILRDGLLASKSGHVWPGVSESGRTYITSDPKWALGWAIAAMQKPGGGGLPVLLKVLIPPDEAGKLSEDPGFFSRAYRFEGNIKPEWITQAWVGRNKRWSVDDVPSLAPERWSRVKSAEAPTVVYVMVLLPETEIEKADPTEPEWRALHRAADALAPKAREAFLLAVAATVENVDEAALAAALRKKDYEAAFRAIPWDDVGSERLAELMPSAMRSVAERAGLASARVLARAGFAMDFDFVNPRMVDAARTATAELVTAVGDETKAAIRSIMGRSFSEGIPPRDAGRLIRPLIGLTERDANAVANMWSRMTEDGEDEGKVDRVVGRYADRLLARRAETISRTETIRAAQIGQEETWLQAAEQGLIDADRATRVWLAAESPRTCPICEFLDGQERKFDEPFVGEGGEEYGGPPDPHPD